MDPNDIYNYDEFVAEKVTDFLHLYEDFVRFYYGERCEEYEANCCICKAWKVFDKFADDVTEKETV